MTRIAQFLLPALLLGTVPMSSPAWAGDTCDAQISSGQIKTFGAHVRCVNRTEAAEAKGPNADLVKFLWMRRIAIAKDMDNRVISRETGYAQMQAVLIDVQTEAQKRQANARAAAQQVPKSSQPIIIQQAPPQNAVTFCNTLGSSTMCF